MLTLISDKRLWILLMALVLLRLPSLNRPLSKHHEFNTAVILINAGSWQQAGGGKQFYYTPLMNYQGKSNRVLDNGWHIDNKGNHVYLSFGAGWYVLPYLLFKILHLPFLPLWLQLLNIFIGFVTVVLLSGLLFSVTGNKTIALAGTALFILLPAPLWYTGIEYVTTAIMLPVVIAILYIWHKMENGVERVNLAYLSALYLLGIILSYFDWLSVFLLAAMAVWSLVQARSKPKYIWVALIAVLSVISGIYLVLMQFAGYLGWEQVLHYWQSRFADRSTDTSEFSFGEMLIMVVKNLLTGFFPLLILLLFTWNSKIFLKSSPKVFWPVWALFAIIPYNGIFFNWSAQHEFAWLAFGLFSVIAITVYFLPIIKVAYLKKIAGTIIILSGIQYFVINLPGNRSIKGDRYDEQAKLGNWILRKVDTAMPIFTTISNEKIVEYYSKRTFNTAQTPEDAKLVMRRFGIDSAIWLGIKNGKVERMVKLLPP